MMRRNWAVRIACVGLLICGAMWAEGPGAPTNLRCEYEAAPMGIDVVRPRLSWTVNDSRQGARQSAYQIVVSPTEALARAGEGSLWDSGQVAGDQSIQVPYAGAELSSRQRCYWSVRTWDMEGNVSAYSAPGVWEMGLLHPVDWQAQWITVEETKSSPNPVFGDWIWHPEGGSGEVTRYFRKEFTLPPGTQVESGRAWGAANNEYTFVFNGKEMGGCDEWKAVETFDITNLIQPGENVIALTGVHARGMAGITFGMRIRLSNGQDLEIRSGEDWRTSVKPAKGWDTVKFDEKNWVNPVIVSKYGEAPWGEVANRYPSRSLYMRKGFSTEQGRIVQARVYASALGAYQLYLNGQRIGNVELSPGWTYFPKHIQYQTYDVTAAIHQGENVLGLLIGNGWWGGSMAGAWKDGNLRAIAQLELLYENGNRQIIGTDETWEGHDSPIVYDSIYHGEIYDARLALDDWCSSTTNTGWRKAFLWTSPMGALVAQTGPGIQVTEELPAVSLTSPRPGVYLFDFGQNAAGRVKLKVNGPEGTRVQIRHGEILEKDGGLFTENLQGAKCTDVYILKGKGEECWTPAFTYRGFRYAELTGYPGAPGLDALTMQVMHAALPTIGSFTCSDEVINRVQKNLLWGARSNFYSVPTDCPQRDERLGWTGDIQLFLSTACWNMHMAGYMTKYMRDVVDSRNPDGSITDVAPARSAGPGAPGWADVVTVVPWDIYTYYGDTRIIEQNYDAMSDWVAYMRQQAHDGLYTMERYGDWLSFEPTQKKLMSGAYQYLSTKLLAEMSGALGKTAEKERLLREAEDIAAKYNRQYFDEARNQYLGHTQTANLVPLWFGITPEGHREAVASNLDADIAAHGYHLTTGFIGSTYLLPVLSAYGLDDTAGRLALQRTCPSWGYMVESGATTIWERWDSNNFERYGNGMNSFNHYTFGSVGRWYYEYLVGIRPLSAGFKHILIEPHPSGIHWATASFNSMHGPIRCSWRMEKGFEMTVEIPANTTARVVTPVDCTMDGAMGKDAAASRLFEIGSGAYVFTAREP